MAAPKPRPAALKLLTGRPGGRDSSGYLVAPPPAFERAAPTAPDWFGPDESAQWDRIVAPYDALGILKEPDRVLLVCLCALAAEFERTMRQVRAEGSTTVNPDSGCPRKNPALTAALEMATALRSLASEFGLSPAAEARLGITPRDTDDNDPFDPTKSPPFTR